MTLSETLTQLLDRVGRLETRREPRHYTTALRPPAADVPGAIVYDTDLAKHYGSNGSTWTALY